MSNIIIGGTAYSGVNTIKIPLESDPSEYAEYSNKDSGLVDGSLSGEYENNQVTAVRAYAFNGFSALTAIVMQKVTSMGGFTFQNCKALRSVDLPQLESIPGAAFTGCSALEELVLPNVATCDIQAVNNCTSLKKVDIYGPKTTSSTRLNTTAFAGDSALETFIIRSPYGVLKLANDNVFADTPIASGAGYVYVHSAMLASYKADSSWATYANQLRAIEDCPDICG